MPQERILVAEDEPDVREMCLRILRRSGFEVVGARDGQEAVQYAQQSAFDLLLTDIKMPSMGGLDAYRAIRASNPQLAAVVMTGFGTMEMAIEALRLGFSEFVIKPFRPDELNEAIQRALAKQRLERENMRLKALIPLFDLSHIFMNSVDLAAIPQHVVRIARQEMQADSASLMLLNDREELTIHSAEGLPAEVVNGTYQKVGEGIAGYVAAHREPMILQGDLHNDPRFKMTYGVDRVASAISLPIIHKEKVLGVLNVARSEVARPFTEGDLELLAVLASQAAIAIDNARLFHEIQEAYEHLAELDHLKSEFLSIASHELRSPLAVVLAYVTLLEEEMTGPLREHMAQVVQAAMQLKSIIDGMTSLQHIDTGSAQVNITALDPAPIIQEVFADLELLASRKNQAVVLNLPANLPLVYADRQLLHLILSNLLSNAIKFTPDEGAVSVTAFQQDDEVTIAICDTGVGIPDEELERIFHRFYQVEDSLRRKHGGIGLGLAIAREMAELMHARIWVESQLDEGSTFFVALPCAETD